jgi:hypothetical protein
MEKEFGIVGKQSWSKYGLVDHYLSPGFAMNSGEVVFTGAIWPG